MPTADDLPDYDPALKAFHAAFEPELTAAIHDYEPGRSARVLDSPCGDGFYAKLFARHMRGGTLVAADLSPAYLDHAKRTVGAVQSELVVKFVCADAYKLPFETSSFDLVWCAQSLISLDELGTAIREMGRVLKPGGRLAVLETDEYHHVLLPWPVGLELAIHTAVREACLERYGSGGKLSPSRKLRAEFTTAGLTPTGKRTVVGDRVAPFGPTEREFLMHHFKRLRVLVEAELGSKERMAFDRFTDADGADGFLNAPDAELTCLAVICHATR